MCNFYNWECININLPHLNSFMISADARFWGLNNLDSVPALCCFEYAEGEMLWSRNTVKHMQTLGLVSHGAAGAAGSQLWSRSWDVAFARPVCKGQCTHLSLQGPFHSTCPHGFLILMSCTCRPL